MTTPKLRTLSALAWTIYVCVCHRPSGVNAAETTCKDPDSLVTVTVYPNGGGGAGELVTQTRQEWVNTNENWGHLYTSEGLPLRPDDFTTLQNNTDLYRAPTKKGTHFVYPLKPIGSKIVIPDVTSPSGIPMELEVLSHSPRVFYVHNFMSQDETNTLIDYATSEDNPYKMARSTGGTHKSWNQGGRGDTLTTRTSMNAFDISTPAALAIKRRAFQLLRIPKYKESMADGIQTLRYETAQAYIAHHDYFPPNQSPDYNWDPAKGGANRFATVFLYLSDVEYGGQTCFPKAARLSAEENPGLVERLGQPPSEQKLQELLKEAGIQEGSWEAKLTRDCYSKFAVPPKKGDAVLFYSQTPDGHLDPSSLHGAGPVLKGTKWGANVWVWNACRYSMCKDGMQPAEEQDFEY
mmetsp:Transcript_29826/g.45735  ORF Transcript_29826/g.45735 Transcript_29826/m.45735 type:complete len:407 (+) Transcript_29826:68-1288(+)